ncbi:MAG: SEC-C metal-binding domain-containing protein, partial [Dehalococcoidia bacterium]
RDNMVIDLSQCVQRPLHYAIVDEVDNILIDEARTPLIISGARAEDLQQYRVFTQLARRLEKHKDYEVDEKTRTIIQTERGIGITENVLRREGLLKGDETLHGAVVEQEEEEEKGLRHLMALQQKVKNALTAKEFYKEGQQYVVTPNREVVIVDEFTGRLMFGRRYSDGLHQAIEAKEGVQIQQESMTLATITFQNYFRIYKKLAGMTGTALTEAEEFYKIYRLEVVVMPTNKPMIRTEHPDQIYKDEKSKFAAVAREIKQFHEQGRPCLIGTTSIEKSESLSDILRRNGIPPQVLNAKHHEKEAAIIAEAGRLGAVTVATNMAGRGVDIILGGNPEERDEAEWQEEHKKVVELGGLHIIGTEHHEARRIDNQLRGRAGRQGDPGSSRFYSSLEDEIVHRFGGDRVRGLMQWAGMGEDTPIEHPIVNKAMSNAQVQTEGHNFNIRKHLVEYDDVINKHREVIYAERRKILSGADLKANILSMVQDEIRSLVDRHLGNANDELEEEQSHLSSLLEDVSAILPLPPHSVIASEAKQSQSGAQQIAEKLSDYAVQLYNQREQEIGADKMRIVERLVMLRAIDRLWMEHLTAMEHMRQGIGLRAVGQEQPLIVYKKEGHALFGALLAGIQQDVVRSIYHVGITTKEAPPKKKEAVMVGKKAGRNDPCPCGSGKKYKHCCGK